MFKSCQLQLHAALSDIDKKDKLIDKLNTKVNSLTGVTLKSRSVAREAKELAKNADLDKQKASKMIEARAADAQEKLLQSQKDQDAQIERVRAQEVDRRQRAVAVIEKKMNTQKQKL